MNVGPHASLAAAQVGSSLAAPQPHLSRPIRNAPRLTNAASDLNGAGMFHPVRRVRRHWIVERIVRCRSLNQTDRRTLLRASAGNLDSLEFLVHWEGYPKASRSWLTVDNFAGGKGSPMVLEFMRTLSDRDASSSGQITASEASDADESERDDAFQKGAAVLTDPEDHMPLTELARREQLKGQFLDALRTVAEFETANQSILHCVEDEMPLDALASLHRLRAERQKKSSGRALAK